MAKVIASASDKTGIRVDFMDDDTISIFDYDNEVANLPMLSSFYRQRAFCIKPTNFHPLDRVVGHILEAYSDISEVEAII